MMQNAASVVIFAGTYLFLALGRVPGLRLDRAGIALVGAAMMLSFGNLSLAEAIKSIDFNTIVLLLGMMLVVGHLRISGAFDWAAGHAIARAHSPLVLLVLVTLVTGVLSAFLVNDAICFVMTPLVITMTRALRRNPVPYLLSVAMASNAGSVATYTGNPQNMIIGGLSSLSYGRFAQDLAPVALMALAIIVGMIWLMHRAEFTRIRFDVTPIGGARLHAWPAQKGALVTLALIAAFFLGVPIAQAAIVGGAVLLVTRAYKPEKIYAQIDGGLLLMFAGLFVVVAGAEKALVTPETILAAKSLHLENFWVLTGLTAALSNVISNVPAVLALKPFVSALPEPARAWEWVAMAATLAGNFTLLGSVANLIVAEKAREQGVEIDFMTYFKVGAPLTLITLFFGGLWLR